VITEVFKGKMIELASCTSREQRYVARFHKQI